MDWRGGLHPDLRRNRQQGPLFPGGNKNAGNDYYHDFSSADAYFILENGLYTLHAVSPGRENGGAAKDTLEELLKLF